MAVAGTSDSLSDVVSPSKPRAAGLVGAARPPLTADHADAVCWRRRDVLVAEYSPEH